MNSLSFHIFGGAEDGGGAYTLYTRTISMKIYNDYTYEFWKNDEQIRITGRKPEPDFDSRNTKVHLSIDQTQFGSYDPNAVYRMIVHYGEHSATYQLWHKYDTAGLDPNSGVPLTKAN